MDGGDDASILKLLILEFFREEACYTKLSRLLQPAHFQMDAERKTLNIRYSRQHWRHAAGLSQNILPLCQPLDLLGLAQKLKISVARPASSSDITLAVAPTTWWNYMQQQNEDSLIHVVEQISDIDLYKELLDWGHSGSVLRMSDGLGLFNNGRVHLAGGVSPSEWLKLDHNRFHLPEELNRYTGTLLRDREIRNFSYNASWPNGQIHQFTVNARLANYRGELVRIVKVVECVPTTF